MNGGLKPKQQSFTRSLRYIAEDTGTVGQRPKSPIEKNYLKRLVGAIGALETYNNPGRLEKRAGRLPAIGKKSSRPQGGSLEDLLKPMCYSRIEEGTPAFRACSCISSSCFLLSSSVFCCLRSAP